MHIYWASKYASSQKTYVRLMTRLIYQIITGDNNILIYESDQGPFSSPFFFLYATSLLFATASILRPYRHLIFHSRRLPLIISRQTVILLFSDVHHCHLGPPIIISRPHIKYVAIWILICIISSQEMTSDIRKLTFIGSSNCLSPGPPFTNMV